ncbi:MAG: SDR family oxidoreductase [Sinimarinibacterium sp.]|jgi:NAD(P)-dependent dehydrogenase (short-subunit alcohol dehydrogenase family)
MEITDKVTIITGAGSGIGRSLAQRFAAKGARFVVCVDLNGADASETAASIGARASAEQLDVGDEAAIEALVARMEKLHGRIDVFVSNAGYGRIGGLEMPTAEWQRMMNVHTWSHLAAARAVVPGMLARGSGYLLSTSSAAGLLSQFDSGAYAVSKHAAVALAEWLAINYVDRGIGVSVLCPQAVRTNIIKYMADPNALVDVVQAAGDGILEPDFVADLCIEAMAAGRFLVLPHKDVELYFQRKASDYDRWLAGMRRHRRNFQKGAG